MAGAQRLADFLRERCSRNQYGLHYLDPEQNLIYIPWPVAPKHNEETPEGFKMFYEWSELSFRRRGNSEAAEKQETLTSQKHRFRNALQRANGIIPRKDMKVDGGKVFQFVESRRGHKCTESAIQNGPLDGNIARQECVGSHVDALYGADVRLLSNGPHNSDAFYAEGQCNFGAPPMHGANARSPTTSEWTTEENEIETMVDLNDLLAENNDPAGMLVVHQSSPCYNVETTDPSGMDGCGSEQQQFTTLTPMVSCPVEGPPELEIVLRFGKIEALRYSVTNQKGCRVYFGKNIPDIKKMVGKEVWDSIIGSSQLRYNSDFYFGLDTLQAIQLPMPDGYMNTPVQKQKTMEIFVNMERGFMLLIDDRYRAQRMNIPDVYAIRLCQTRIFPYSEGSSGPNAVTLPRQESIKLFDGQAFLQQLAMAEQSHGQISTPRPTFSLSLGQRPPCNDKTLIMASLKVTVQSAEQLIQSRVDCDRLEVCISDLTSVDKEAKDLAEKLTRTCTLNDDFKMPVCAM